LPGAFAFGFRDEIMSVKMFAFDRDKNIAGLKRARVYGISHTLLSLLKK